MSTQVVELARRLAAIMGAERASAAAVAVRLGLTGSGDRAWEGIAALPGAGAARLVADEHGRADCLTIAVDADRLAMEAAFGRPASGPRMQGADFERLGFHVGTGAVGVLLYADVDDLTGRVVALTLCRE